MRFKFTSRRNVIKIVISTLLITIFSPVQSAAPAAENITKTFTIRGADNSLLTGALVRLIWNDEITGSTMVSDIGTTNSSGVATATAPKNAPGLAYVVVPASGDTSNAIAAFKDTSSLADEAISVKLETASLVINAQKSDGTAAATTGVLCWPANASETNGSNCSLLLRSGGIGIKLPSDLDTTKVYNIALLQYTDQYTPGQFSWRYGFKASGSAGSQTYTVYTDLSATTALTQTSGAYVIKYSGANIAGTLKKADGTSLTITSGMLVNVVISPDFSTTVQGASSNDFFDSSTSPNGNWNGRVFGPAGKYKVLFNIAGSLTIPSFVTYIWKNSSGGFSTSENGTYTTSAPHALQIRLPAQTPNFVFKTVKSGTNDAMGVYPSLESKISGTNDYTYIAGNRAPNGIMSSLLTDGDYRLSLSPYDEAYASIVVTIQVSNGVATVKNAAGTTLTPTSGVYTFSPLEPNVKFKAVSAANTSTVINDSYIEIFNGSDGKGGSVGGRGTGSTFAGFNLADGTYMVRANGGAEWLKYADNSVVLTVSGGVPSINGLTASSGIFSIPLNTKNLQYKLVDTDGTTPIVGGWIDACLWDAGTSSKISCQGEGTNQNGEGGASLSNGTYKITMFPGSSSSKSPKTYDATVASGVVSITGVTASGGVFALQPSTANLSGSLKDSGGSNNLVFGQNQGVNVSVQKEVNGNWQWTDIGSWRTSASFGLNISTVGHYRLVAQPQGFTDLAWSYSNEFWAVSAGGGVNLTTVSASDAGTSSLSNFNISVKGSNLKLKITDPRDSSLLKYGWVTILKKETNGNQSWVMNADINSNNPGYAGANLSDGNYRLELNPQQGPTLIAGLARKYYDAVVSGSGTTVSVSYNGTSLTADGNGRFNLTPASANVIGRVLNQSGTAVTPGNNKWVNINVQKYIAAENRWDWSNNWANTDNDGFFNISVSEAGKYRLRIEPNGYADSTVTFSSEFTISAGSESTFKISFGNVTLAAPSLKIRAVASGSTTSISNMGVEIRKNNNWLDWANIGQSGIGAVAFKEAGKYQLVVHPNEASLNAGATRKSYDVVAVANSDGTISASVTGLTANNEGVYTLTLGTGTLAGTVFGTDGTTAIRDSQVVAVNSLTKQEMWEYSANSSATGKWSMNLPAGTYSIYARAPWGTNSYGSSDQIATVTVDSSGVATLSGAASSNSRTTSAFNISLKAPTWTGQVKTPTGVSPDAGIAYANICLFNSDVWNCTTADASGNWALSAPSSFTAFSSNAMFIISDPRERKYPELRYEGATAVSTAMGGLSATGLTHRFVGANIKITVTAGGVVVPNVWVTVDRPNVGWLAGNSTNAQGISPLYVADLSQPLNVRIELNGNKDIALNYAPTMKTFSGSDITAATSSSIFSATIALDSPNVKAVVKEPTVSGVAGSTAPWSWVELFKDSDNSWVSGSNTDDNGSFSMNAPKPVSGTISYTMVINPPWNSTGNSSRQQYTVTVASDNSVVVKLKSTGNTVGAVTEGSYTYYPLTLAQPSVRGTVVNSSDVGTRDSWVVPINTTTGEWLWQQGTNSRTGGAFGISVPDGSYKVQANVPWNATGLANSAQCGITVSGGAITTAAGGCVQGDGTLKLALRAPNLTMTLTLNGSPVPFANVNVRLGGWNTSSQSNKDGQVSLFVDRTAIMAANPNLTGSANDLWVTIDPPYGTSEMVRWECQSGDSKPVCSGMTDFNVASEYPTTALGSIPVVGPNTKLRVIDPTTSANVGAGAWVALLEYKPSDPSYGVRWIAGSNTDSSGYAAFNVDTATVATSIRYKIEVNPPWNKKSDLSGKTYDNSGSGLQLTDINNQNFNLGTPNAYVTVMAPNTTSANSWGWIGIEEVNSSNQWVAWLGGYGLDNLGKAAITLSANKRYRITANPSGGREGTRTECIITTDTSTVITRVTNMCNRGAITTVNSLSSLQINLNAGNVVGTVKSPSGKLVVGATIYANVTGATDEVDSVTTSTNALGVFGLNLDPNKTWTIKIFPFNAIGATEVLANKTYTPNITGWGSGTNELGDITLALKP
jgi:hypothetical protein